MLSNYYILFGSQIPWKSCIKIEDSLGAFISYTFSISNAIEKYIIPQPQICPLIIDLWIIPNKTITLKHKMIKNEIGDIDERLRRNKLRFIKKVCNSNDITQTSYSMQECLWSANIRHGLKHKNVNRIVFIIDRRYRNKDYLYCYIPPSKYSKLQQNVNDILHICQVWIFLWCYLMDF